MNSLPRPLSIHDLTPLEMGGPIARKGFEFQDHVAVTYCLEMLKQESLKAVWCETHDDITLIWAESGVEWVEFIQVKSDQPDQLWSISLLCSRERTKANPTGAGTSIFEKSLARDRCAEECRFRLVTSRDVKTELKLLSYPLNSVLRMSNTKTMSELEKQISDKVSNVISVNGRGVKFWLSRALWEVRESESALKNHNMLLLDEIIWNEGVSLAPDQREAVYLKLLRRVQEASLADWSTRAQEKKLNRLELLTWIQKTIAETQHPVTVGGGNKLREKMEASGISEDSILSAFEQREFYRREFLNRNYLSLSDLHLVSAEVKAMLLELRTELDTGTIQESGDKFHERCLHRLEQMRENWHGGLQPPLAVLQGCMYDITNRCLHRFREVQP